MTELVQVDRDRPNPDDIARAADCLRRGGLVAFPTETVYGLGADALNRDALHRLFAAKQRPANDPLIVHVAEFSQVPPLCASIPPAAAELAARFWPGPLTLILRRSSTVPVEVTAGLDTVAIRIPAHPVARALLLTASIPVAAPSANLFSRPSPTRASHVLADLDGRIDMVIDGGVTDVGVESTVLDLTVEPAAVLRPGAVSIERLRRVVPAVHAVFRGKTETPMPSPGLLSKHYAPRAAMTLFRGATNTARAALVSAVREAVALHQRVGILATRDDARMLDGLSVEVAQLGPDEHAEEIAARLYAALRELDSADVDVIFVRDVTSGEGLWRALHDRLERAATNIIDVD